VDVGHDHAHGHAHAHGVAAEADRGKLWVALALLAGFLVFELAVGVVVGSLALISDALHMLTDTTALALAIAALSLARRPAGGNFTFGLRRAEILSAQFNGATLLIFGLWIVYEGIQRVVDPPELGGLPVLLVALVGIAVNLAATWTLARADRRALNVEGAFQHVLTDLAAFLFTALAGAVILLTGFARADGIASLVIAAIMLRAAYGLLRESGRVFLEAAPRGIDVAQVGRALAAAPGVVEVHDLHVWEVTSGFPALSAHVTVSRQADCHAARRDLEALLHARFGLDHTTLQVDHEGGELLSIEAPEQRWTTP
jgi:cobalt-zinc-cadmium efflux system protein